MDRLISLVRAMDKVYIIYEGVRINRDLERLFKK